MKATCRGAVSRDPAPHSARCGVSALLSVSRLNVAYGEAHVLFDVDMEVRASEIVACVGRNGAGKTTLLRSIAGFVKPESGSVTAGGETLVGLRAFAIA